MIRYILSNINHQLFSLNFLNIPIGNKLFVKEADDFFEQVCVEDFNTREDVIHWKQLLNEIRYSTYFFRDVWDALPFDQNSITMHLMSHCKVSIYIYKLKYLR